MKKKILLYSYIFILALMTQYIADMIDHIYGDKAVFSWLATLTHDETEAKKSLFKAYCCSESECASVLRSGKNPVPILSTGGKRYLVLRVPANFTYPAFFQYQIGNRGWLNSDVYEAQLRYTTTIIPCTGEPCDFTEAKWLIYSNGFRY